jgi:hypothetical protein
VKRLSYGPPAYQSPAAAAKSFASSSSILSPRVGRRAAHRDNDASNGSIYGPAGC